MAFPWKSRPTGMKTCLSVDITSSGPPHPLRRRVLLSHGPVSLPNDSFERDESTRFPRMLGMSYRNPMNLKHHDPVISSPFDFFDVASTHRRHQEATYRTAPPRAALNKKQCPFAGYVTTYGNDFCIGKFRVRSQARSSLDRAKMSRVTPLNTPRFDWGSPVGGTKSCLVDDTALIAPHGRAKHHAGTKPQCAVGGNGFSKCIHAASAHVLPTLVYADTVFV